MREVYFIVFMFFFAIFVIDCNSENDNKNETKLDKKNVNFEYQKSEEEWKKILSPEEFNVLRKKGTERPHTGQYNLNFKDGVYLCKGCGNKLFDSDTKFESECGWPSFYDVKHNSAVKEIVDSSYGMIRTEVVCSKCGGHLGHVFDDGPNPTGLRYCINSVSIDFLTTSEEDDGKN
jgi:peptide-methionine (R)-S-oxide reductase